MSEVTTGAQSPVPADASASDRAACPAPAQGASRQAPAPVPVAEQRDAVSPQPAEPDLAGTTGSDAADAVGWRESMRVGLWTWLGGLLMYVLVTVVAWMPSAGQAPAGGQAYQAWNRWDTVWYVIIADSGYRYDPRSVAFFPLYPLLVRAAHHVLPGGTFEAALILSVLACLVALVMVHRLTAEIAGPAVARRTAFYLLAFPTGFYLAAAYNEGLFVALAAASLYCMRRRHWWLAGLLAGFASGTRMAGALLGLAFLYEYLRQRGFALSRIRWDVLWVALTPSGLLLYALYCWRAFGDPLFFEKMQANWFHSKFQDPLTTLVQVAELIGRSHPALGADTVRNIVNWTTAVGALLLLLVALDRRWGLGREQAYLVIFSAGVIVMPLVNPIQNYYPLSSMWRFALECSPVFMVLAKMGRNPRFDRLYTMGALALQGVMIVTFLQNQFVA